MPTGSEVGVIIPGAETAANLDVVLHTRSGPLQRINAIHRSYDSLHYILILPYGTDGFHLHIPHAAPSKKFMSPAEFYRYHLQIRQDHGNFLMKSRRLMQQYACDQFAKVESQRLKYIASHQQELKADKYRGLLDAVNAGDGRNAGIKTILPPSVYGSPRFYAEAFQDSMAIVRHYGKPSLFITFTCNANWPEIKESLFEGESPCDRPDLSCRVFNLKLGELLEDLVKKEILGRVDAYTAVVEFQKRGLPHVSNNMRILNSCTNFFFPTGAHFADTRRSRQAQNSCR